mmetsp:Transcript_20959/g.45554  ORF Transcript_20959/g.45554 Transcript_20959/m.45554 type:complete len:241 (-) Transcript_20959:554-1276(-)
MIMSHFSHAMEQQSIVEPGLVRLNLLGFRLVIVQDIDLKVPILPFVQGIVKIHQGFVIGAETNDNLHRELLEGCQRLHQFSIALFFAHETTVPALDIFQVVVAAIRGNDHRNLGALRNQLRQQALDFFADLINALRQRRHARGFGPGQGGFHAFGLLRVAIARRTGFVPSSKGESMVVVVVVIVTDTDGGLRAIGGSLLVVASQRIQKLKVSRTSQRFRQFGMTIDRFSKLPPSSGTIRG